MRPIFPAANGFPLPDEGTLAYPPLSAHRNIARDKVSALIARVSYKGQPIIAP